MANKKSVLSYVLVFGGFLGMFFFMLPIMDVFVFYRESGGAEWTLSGVLNSALYYGNGRFLGNVFLYLLSHNFEVAVLVVSLTLLCIVFSMNMLLFDNRYETIFLVAILVAIPGEGMIRELYYMLASFLNYVFPIALILLSMVLIQQSQVKAVKGRIRVIMDLLVMALLYAACLFSENTSIALLATAIVYLGYRFFVDKRLTIPLLLQGISVFLGVATMFLIPPLTGTAHKLDYYRGVSTTLFALIDQCIGNYIAFATYFSTCIPVIVLLSVGFAFMVKTECASLRSYGFLITISILYPVACIGFSILDANIVRMNWLYLMHVVLLSLLIVGILLASFHIHDKRRRIIILAFITVVFFSIAPMMVVTLYGYRTYYTTFISVLVFALYLIREYCPVSMRRFFIESNAMKGAFIRSSLLVFVFASAFLFQQTMYNFAFYSVRAEDIIRQSETKDVLEVPVLPCSICSMEEFYITSISVSIGCEPYKVHLINVYTGDNAAEYFDVMQASPMSVLQIALDHSECRDPGLFDGIMEP